VTLKFRHILYSLTFFLLFIILSWFFAIPDDLLKKKIEDSISSIDHYTVNSSISSFKKGLFFSFRADSLDVKNRDTHLFNITYISGRINPFSLIKGELLFSIRGKLGEGDIEGSFRLPQGGKLKITNANLRLIDYLPQIGIETSGNISSDIILKDSAANITFDVPDLNIENVRGVSFPFINSFRHVQGALSLNEYMIKISSVSFEGTKGYARLKGAIDRGIMDLALELMPSSQDVTQMELMLIQKYLVSPGYYVIPIKGHFPFIQR